MPTDEVLGYEITTEILLLARVNRLLLKPSEVERQQLLFDRNQPASAALPPRVAEIRPPEIARSVQMQEDAFEHGGIWSFTGGTGHHKMPFPPFLDRRVECVDGRSFQTMPQSF